MKNILFFGFLFTYVQAIGFTETVLRSLTKSPMRDIYSTRANTLSDDADDLQKQLDNEAKDRAKFGRPKEVWILHFPHIAGFSGVDNLRLPWSSKANKKCVSETNCTCDGTCECSNKVNCTISTEKMDCANNSLVKLANTSNETKSPKENQDYELDCNRIVDWDYKDQKDWKSLFPACGGVNQSPVDLPYSGMMRTKKFRQIIFKNYDTLPTSMSIVQDGKTVSVYGEWPASRRPLIYGGAAYSRRYLFHSLAVHWPSEHTIGGLSYPMETQAIHISAEYKTLHEALKAAPKDRLSVLTVANIYMFSSHNHKGLEELIKGFMSTSFGTTSITARPLKVFNPPLKEYAVYHGSLTTPPCTESVLWLVRARSLPIKRALAEILTGQLVTSVPGQTYFRASQPVNDRKIYFFD